jgi:hypothetical protein
MSLSNSGGRIGVVWEEEAIHCSQGQLGKWQCHVTHTQIPVRLIRMLNLFFLNFYLRLKKSRDEVRECMSTEVAGILFLISLF